MEIRSILNDILNVVNNETNVNIIKHKFIERVTHSKIKEKDKTTMLNGINKRNSYYSVVKFIYDCLLKYEGEGVINKSLNGYKLKVGK